jgi:hypothetical protein
VTIAIRPSVGRDDEGYRFDLGLAGTEIFLKMGLDSRTTERPVGQISHEYLVDLILKSARIYLQPRPFVTASPLSPEERAFARVSKDGREWQPQFKVREFIPHASRLRLGA